MNTRLEDYLWNPEAPTHADVASLECTLQPLRAAGDRLVARGAPQLEPKRRRPAVWIALAASLLLIVAAVHVHRLRWQTDAPWSATVFAEGASPAETLLQVGDSFTTNGSQSATLQVARIGSVTLGADSALTLTRTESGRHRVALHHGRMHARIWAPPGYFGVTHSDASILDLGCEFDLALNTDGSGELAVRSGWVAYLVRGTEVLVPAGHVTTFDTHAIATPVRNDATSAFRHQVAELDAKMQSETSIPQELATAVALQANDADRYTLLSLLTRYPQLANTDLYPQLARALGAPLDEQQRVRWINGDQRAFQAWWALIPQPPKRWWLHWRDAF